MRFTAWKMTFGKWMVWGGLGLLVLAGCSGEEDPANRVTRLRVLAVQADPPMLQFGETSSIKSLVFESPGKESAEYEWSWCPFPAGRATGYECAVEEAQMRDLLDQYLPGSSSQLPSFSLGTGEEAEFSNTIPPAILESLCLAVTSVELPEFVELPSCDRQIDIVVKLTVTQGDEKVVAIKEIPLLLSDDAPVNLNPVLGALFAWSDDSDPPEGGEILDDAGPLFQRDSDYRLEVEVAESEAERYLSSSATANSPEEFERETLFVSWYVTAGETEFSRTSYIEDKISISDLRENILRTPSKIDYEAQTAQIYVVLQDSRGGVDWLERTFRFAE